ncbi:hypothetical protein ABW21_db0206871 [Orbilia brochopaga]|nr:hypothetical protein ABW21_db0206871 [Drechslerella brochopaga]
MSVPVITSIPSTSVPATAVDTATGSTSPQDSFVPYKDDEAELRTPESAATEYGWHHLDEHYLARAEAFCMSNCYRLLRRIWGMYSVTAYLGLPVVEVDRRIYRDHKEVDGSPHPVGTAVLHWLTVLADYTPGNFELARCVLHQAFHESRAHPKFTFSFPPYLTVEDIHNAIQLLRPSINLDRLGRPVTEASGNHTPRIDWVIPKISSSFSALNEDQSAAPSQFDSPFYGFRLLPEPRPSRHNYGEPTLNACYSSVRVASQAAKYLYEVGYSHDQDILLSTVDHFRRIQRQPWLPDGFMSWSHFIRASVHEIDLAFRDQCFFLVMAKPRNRSHPPQEESAPSLGDRSACAPGTITTRHEPIVTRALRRSPRLAAAQANNS